MESTGLSHVARVDELYRLHHLLEEHGRVLLLGVAGIGKSQLARDYVDFFDLDYHQQTLTLSFSETTYTEIVKTAQTATLDSPMLVIIDGLDKFQQDDRDRVLRFIKTSRYMPIRIAIIGRGSEPEIVPFLSAGIGMRLYGLTGDQVKELASQLKWKSGLKEAAIPLYMSLAQTYDGNPAAIHALFEAHVIKDKFTLEVFGVDTVLSNQIHYRRDSFPPPLITDIKVVDQELSKIVAQDPKAVYLFSPRKFEELVAEVFAKLGYGVTLTQATRDGGRDLYLLENKGFGQMLYFVECKRNNSSRPVGVSVIRQLNGVVDAKKATAGIVVTSSHFSKPAEEFQKSIEYKMNLINYNKLLELIGSLNQK